MRRLFMGAWLVVTVACGGGDGRSSATSTVKMGEICDAFSELTCAWFTRCGFELPGCAQSYRDACCSGAACNQEVEGVLTDWRDCYEEILDDASCSGEIDVEAWDSCGG